MLFVAIALVSALHPQSVEDTIREVCARSAGVATAETIGSSRGGAPIHAITLAVRDDAELAVRPALLVVAGAHGHHRLGTDLALHHAAMLVERSAEEGPTRDLLERCVVYVVPQLNPDGAALGQPGNARSLDLDRDGALDEDPPDDLDGDGQIAQMRWVDPEGTWLIDPEDPRLMRVADRDQGERGTHELAREGRDNDGDGERDEDPGEGVELHRGFAHDFATFDRRAGSIPLGEPEARALADFVFARPHIGMALVYGTDNNLLGKPKTDPGKGRALLKGILEGDAKFYAAAGERYRELTHRKGKVADRHDGSVWSWLYFHAGVPTFATDVWQLPEESAKKKRAKNGDGAKPPDPEIPDPEAQDPEPEDPEAQDPEKRADPGRKAATPNPDTARLAHCERVGRGFAAWQQVDHPELGEVEVGGFVEGLDEPMIPDDERDPTLTAHHEFLLEMAGWLPHCEIEEFTVTERGDGVFEVEAAVVNTGRLPALTAMSERCRRFAPPRLQLELGEAALVAGRLQSRTDNLEGSGGRQEFRWVVTGAAGTTLRLELITDFSGRDVAEVTL